MYNVQVPPYIIFLFEKPFHLDIYHNSEGKITETLFLVAISYTASQIVTMRFVWMSQKVIVWLYDWFYRLQLK